MKETANDVGNDRLEFLYTIVEIKKDLLLGATLILGLAGPAEQLK